MVSRPFNESTMCVMRPLAISEATSLRGITCGFSWESGHSAAVMTIRIRTALPARINNLRSLTEILLSEWFSLFIYRYPTYLWGGVPPVTEDIPSNAECTGACNSETFSYDNN